MRKKVFCILASSLALGLASCGGQSVSSSSAPSLSDSTTMESMPAPTYEVDPDVVITPENEVTSTKVRTYDGPALMESSKEVSVSVEGQNLFVYETLVNHGRVFSWIAPTTKAAVVLFDFEGRVHVDVEIANPSSTIVSAALRPVAYSIPVEVSGNKLSFDLTHPGNYVLEYNDDPTTAVHIFANPIETDLPILMILI